MIHTDTQHHETLSLLEVLIAGGTFMVPLAKTALDARRARKANRNRNTVAAKGDK